jgi:hypothetical protein
MFCSSIGKQKRIIGFKLRLIENNFDSVQLKPPEKFTGGFLF